MKLIKVIMDPNIQYGHDVNFVTKNADMYNTLIQLPLSAAFLHRMIACDMTAPTTHVPNQQSCAMQNI